MIFRVPAEHLPSSLCLTGRWQPWQVTGPAGTLEALKSEDSELILSGPV